MKILIFLVFLGINGAAAVRHSLQYFYTASSGITGFPEFVTVGEVDKQPFTYYDSVIKKEIPKQDWMAKTKGPEYWESETQISIGAEQSFRASIDHVKQRFNQTRGVYVVQKMYGCEWDDETGEVNGFSQFGYDGEDYLIFDMKTETWIAPTPQALITKINWDHNKFYIESDKQYLTQICPEWVKKYVNYGRSSLLRTALPSVSLLQKTPSSPVSCHATGFYPDRAMMFWRKDGEELHEDVDQGEILPNHDGTFQMSVDLTSAAPEDWGKYECVFQLSGVKEDIIKRLDKAVIISNEKPTDTTPIIIAAVVVLALVIAIAAIGFFIYKKKNNKRPPSPASSQEVIEQTKPLSA